MAELYRPLVPTQVSDFPLLAVSTYNKKAKVRCFNAQRPEEIANLFTGIAFAANEIVVCDHENKKIKRYKFDGQYIESLKLSDPTGICAVPGSNDVVVTEPDIRQITFCSLEGNTRVSTYSQTKKKYECVRALDELKFIVGCCDIGSPSVDVIDPNGNVLRSIQNTKDEQTLFRNPAAVSCLTSGEVLISDPGCSQLICISLEGKLLFKNDLESRPSGICTDSYGGIYMADYDSNEVNRLLPDGTKENIFINEDIKISSPLALAVTPDGKHLLMTEDVPSERIVIIKLPSLTDTPVTGLSLGNVMVRLNSSQGHFV